LTDLVLIRDKLAHHVSIARRASSDRIDVELHVAVVLRIDRLFITAENVQPFKQIAHELFAVNALLFERINLPDGSEVCSYLLQVIDIASIGSQTASSPAVVVDD